MNGILIFRDSIIFACANSGTSFLAGFVIFPVLGFMADELNVPIKDVAAAGEVKFIAYKLGIVQYFVRFLKS